MENVQQGGAPFGAVVVKDGQIIAEGQSLVASAADPTAHAEMVAIRKAVEVLKTRTLAGCSLYTSCEPCVMCLGAIYWAKLNSVYYANTQYDAKLLGMDDAFLYGQLNMPYDQRSIPFQQVLDAMALEVFDMTVLKTHQAD